MISSYAQFAPFLIVFSGLVHAIVNAILKAGKDKMSSRALIDGFSALLVAPAALIVPLPDHAWGWLCVSWVVHLLYLFSRSYSAGRGFGLADIAQGFELG